MKIVQPRSDDDSRCSKLKSKWESRLAATGILQHAFRFVAFCFAGGVGFLVDVMVLWLLMSELGLFLGRVVSVVFAVTTSWVINRNIAFRDRRTQMLLREWVRYVATNAWGVMVNYAIYAIMILSVPFVAEYPEIGVAGGSVAGVIVNFTVSSRWVFRQP